MIKTQTFPTGGWPEPKAQAPEADKGENALTISSVATPATMNKEIPEPNPYFCTISSIIKTTNPPKNNWNIIIKGEKPA